MIKINKKGSYNIDSLPKITLAFILAGIFFVIGIVILQSVQDNATISPLTTVTNESLTYTANNTISLAKGYVVALTSVKNTTGTECANITLTGYGTSAVGTIYAGVNSTACSTGRTVYATYTYDAHDSSAGTVVGNSITAIAEIPNNWMTLLALILAASIVIGIVITHMKGRE